MAIKHETVSVGTTATSLLADVADQTGYDVVRTVVLQNNSGSTVYLGGPAVTSADYGYVLADGREASFDLTLGDDLYAVVASGTADIHALHLGVI